MEEKKLIRKQKGHKGNAISISCPCGKTYFKLRDNLSQENVRLVDA